jgi:hypothetical protein
MFDLVSEVASSVGEAIDLVLRPGERFVGGGTRRPPNNRSFAISSSFWYNPGPGV